MEEPATDDYMHGIFFETREELDLYVSTGQWTWALHLFKQFDGLGPHKSSSVRGDDFLYHYERLVLLLVACGQWRYAQKYLRDFKICPRVLYRGREAYAKSAFDTLVKYCERRMKEAGL